nr:MAG TPA: hypothetical protein [Caudoviricetes sp.]
MEGGGVKCRIKISAACRSWSHPRRPTTCSGLHRWQDIGRSGGW